MTDEKTSRTSSSRVLLKVLLVPTKSEYSPLKHSLSSVLLLESESKNMRKLLQIIYIIILLYMKYSFIFLFFNQFVICNFYIYSSSICPSLSHYLFFILSWDDRMTKDIIRNIEFFHWEIEGSLKSKYTDNMRMYVFKPNPQKFEGQLIRILDGI